MKVLIVDDEAPARDRLRQILQDENEYTVVGEATNGREAIEESEKLKPDVVLLDIRMPELSGIEAAHHLNSLAQPPAVVFTTAYDEYAIDAFEANAIGYVLKPIRRERLTNALQQAARLSNRIIDSLASASGISESRSHLCMRVQDELKLIPISDVHYFVADQKYVRVKHDDGEFLIDESLKALEQEFNELFVRIHRGALVALAGINSLQRNADGQTCVITRDNNPDEESLIISRRHLANVRRRLKGN